MEEYVLTPLKNLKNMADTVRRVTGTTGSMSFDELMSANQEILETGGGGPDISAELEAVTAELEAKTATLNTILEEKGTGGGNSSDTGNSNAQSIVFSELYMRGNKGITFTYYDIALEQWVNFNNYITSPLMIWEMITVFADSYIYIHGDSAIEISVDIYDEEILSEVNSPVYEVISVTERDCILHIFPGNKNPLPSFGDEDIFLSATIDVFAQNT